MAIKKITVDGVVYDIGGSGGGITIYTLVQPCTAVPIDDTTLIENVYFNTSLSEAEVIETIDNAFALVPDFVEMAGTMTYVLMNQTTETMIMIEVFDGAYLIQAMAGEVDSEEDAVVFIGGPGAGEIGLSFTGWNPNFNGVLPTNVTNSDLYQMASAQGFLATFETLNEALKTVISSTPF